MLIESKSVVKHLEREIGMCLTSTCVVLVHRNVYGAYGAYSVCSHEREVWTLGDIKPYTELRH